MLKYLSSKKGPSMESPNYTFIDAQDPSAGGCVKAAGGQGWGQAAECAAAFCTHLANPHQTRHLCLPTWINCFLFWPGNLLWLVSKAPRYKLLRNFLVFGKILNCYLKPTKRKHKPSKNRSAHHRTTCVCNTRAEIRSNRQIGIFKRNV